MTKWVTQVGLAEVPHVSAESKEAYERSLMPHEREARVRGIPSMGAGAIYPVPEEDIVCAPFQIPLFYRHVFALDVGWNKTAALWAAIDPETDIAYLYSEYYRGEAEPPIHAQAIKSRGDWIPGVIDPASRGRGQKDGEQLLQIYTALGLHLIPANNAVESGLYEVWTRLSAGKLKVFNTLQNFLSEFRIYRRDEKGKIVKANDHLMDCVRYFCVSGIAVSSQRPPDQWGGLVGRPKHLINYNPLEYAQVNTPQNVAVNRSQWLPHSNR